MVTVTTTTGYLINKASAEAALRVSEPLFSVIIGIVKNVDPLLEVNSTFTFRSNEVRQGVIMKHPAVTVTKSDVATFLTNLSGQNISANSITQIVISSDSSYVEVIITP